MNTEQFKQAVNALDKEALQAILDGKALKIEKDESLAIGRSSEAYVIYHLGEEQYDSPEALKADLLVRAESLLSDYYQFNPLSEVSFNRQLMALINAYPSDHFISMPGQPEKGRIFVNQDILVAEGEESPRFKYGMALELDEVLPEQALSNKLKSWVSSGNAYRDYISINVCRFSCFD